MFQHKVLAIECHGNLNRPFVFWDCETLEANFGLQAVLEIGLHIGDGYFIVGALGARATRDNCAKVELNDLKGMEKFKWKSNTECKLVH
jgi:coenzyme F420-reducing hydrogenase delta subunit